MNHSVFDDEFKNMAVELSKMKSSINKATNELDINASRLSKRGNNSQFNGGKIMMDVARLIE